MLTPGTILGDRYEIIEKIGAGGMSIVYKARDSRLQRFVAIKVLRDEFATDEEFVAKFRKEALAAASLSHPNIVGIYDVGSDHELHYIVMEYVEGKTLKDLISEEGPFDSRMVLEFGTQIVSALRHAHRKKIIHRDIKPQNILVTHDHVLKVTDFGIAKAVDSSTIVATGNAIGSVHYFSPEQAKGKYVNETSDLYSCGIVLFELATKKLPFEADSHISIALKHINEDLPMPSQFNSQVLPGLEKLILKATHKSQSARYQNADEMLKDMKGILSDPHYIVKSAEVTENTILLTDLETDYLRNGANKAAVSNKNVKPNSYTEMPAIEPEEENESELSTFYKVLVSIGGVLATLLVVAIVSAALIFWLPGMTKAKDVQVPNLTGKTLEQAEEFLKSYKLKVKMVGEEPSDLAPVGTIFKQTPNENESVKRNTVIEVTIAKAPIVEDTKVTVPDVKNMAREAAEKELAKYELLADIEAAYDDNIEEGKVIEQIPAAGQSVDKQTHIRVIVSKGPEEVLTIVPNLANMSLDDVKISLRNAKLKLGTKKEEPSDVVAKGLVVNQSISPNEEVKEDTVINIVISSGKKAETEPTQPDPADNNNPSSDNAGLVTKNITLGPIPESMQGKDSYHVVAKLTTDDGTSKIVFDQQVQASNYPPTISVQGKGTGSLETLFDGQSVYMDPVDFSGGQ